MITNHLTCLLQGFHTTNIQSYGGIEFQCTSSGRSLRISEHNSNFLTKLVDKDNYAICFINNTSQFTKCLTHQTCLHTNMTVSHISIDLCFRNQCRYRVNNNDIQCTGTYHRLKDLQRLLSTVRLGNVKFINIYTDIFCIYRIQCMLCINEPCNSSTLLSFCNHMQSNGRLTTGFRTIHFDNTSTRYSTNPQCNIQTQCSGWN